MIKIEIKNGAANLYTPYNPDFIKRIKGIGGAKWDGSNNCWLIPVSAIDAAREIMTTVYGYSDIQENETISLKVIFNKRAASERSDVVLYGKILAHAYGRDSGARVGEDVAYISGGSRNNWDSIVEEGSVIILSNVNKHVYERSKPEYDITVEVLDTKANRQQLIEEKMRLLKRIKEIDKQLLQEETKCE